MLLWKPIKLLAQIQFGVDYCSVCKHSLIAVPCSGVASYPSFVSNVMGLRTQYKDAFLKKHGVKLGFMSAFVKASAYALQDQPVVNAVIDGNEIVYRDYVDVSIAVSTPKVS